MGETGRVKSYLFQFDKLVEIYNFTSSDSCKEKKNRDCETIHFIWVKWSLKWLKRLLGCIKLFPGMINLFNLCVAVPDPVVYLDLTDWSLLSSAS